jgi:hypothetical protein
MDPIEQYSIDACDPYKQTIQGDDEKEQKEFGIMPSINRKKLCNDVIMELEEPDMSLLLSNTRTRKEEMRSNKMDRKLDIEDYMRQASGLSIVSSDLLAIKKMKLL